MRFKKGKTNYHVKGYVDVHSLRMKHRRVMVEIQQYGRSSHGYIRSEKDVQGTTIYGLPYAFCVYHHVKKGYTTISFNRAPQRGGTMEIIAERKETIKL